MKAIILEEYGSPDVLEIQEIEKPVPDESEILVRVKATSVNYGELIARNFKNVTLNDFNMPALFWVIAKFSFGLNKPKVKILGSEFSGVVESTGSKVTKFKPGDEVFGYLGQSMGAYAEYICVSEKGVLTHKPANVDFDHAAVLPYGAIMALGILKKAEIQPGQNLLINGASGEIGSAAIQIANNAGAQVTGVCSNPRMEYVKNLGADKVIDYTIQDFTEGDEKYDIIFDVLGRSSFKKVKKVLASDGKYILASFKMKQLIQMLRTSFSGGQKVICTIAPGSLEDLLAVKSLIEENKLRTEIDKIFPMDHAAEAHEYVENGNKKGKVVIRLS